jgi:hypothetical protein
MASQERLINLFERIQFFLGRLRTFTEIPLTKAITELLGKIMAQLLSILALSTKAMTEKRISKSIDALCPFYANDDSGTFLRRLAGRTYVDDALMRLDWLTTEEGLMTMAESTHRVNVNVKEMKTLAEQIDHDVKATKDGT